MDITTDMGISKKLSTLLMVLSGNRVNCLTNLKVTNMYITDTECTFVFDSVLKHSRPSFNDKPLIFREFSDNSSLCPVYLITRYLEGRLTKSLLESLFITTTKPYKQASSSDTIARWIKETMSASGIDTGKFKTHSCRAASTSAASMRGVSLTTIIKSASWSNDSTFKKYYLREIEEIYNKVEENFGTKLLESYVQ